MKANQKLVLRTHNDLKDGQVTLAYDSETELCDYDGMVHAHNWIIGDKTLPFKGRVKIPREKMLSSFIKPKAQIAMGPVQIQIESVVGKSATFSVVVTLDGRTFSGTGTADLSHDIVRLVSLNAGGKVFGFTENLELVAV